MSFTRCTKDSPCRICRGADWCRFSSNGACLCYRSQMRNVSGYRGPYAAPNGGFIYHPSTPALGFRSDFTAFKFTKGIERPPVDWAGEVQQSLQNSHERTKELAGLLGVNPEALTDLECGWLHGKWTFPMRDGDGQYCGVLARDHAGQKRCLLHSKKGLFFHPEALAKAFEQDDLPILLAEGPSDTAPPRHQGLVTVHGHEVLGDGTWQNGAYQDPRCREGHAALCTSALLQAIGRARSHLPEGRGENPGRMADRTAGFYRAEGWGREGCPLGRWKKRRMR